jgi:N-acetylmuramoyl-L-alanine amidase
MGRIFISAGHGGFEFGVRDPGAIVGETTEAQEMILLRDLIVPELRSRGFQVLSVPDDLSAQQTIDWINSRYRPQDVAIELHADTSRDPTLRGATVFYIALNEQRRQHAELLLFALLRRVPELPSRGTRPDTQSNLGSLDFCRGLLLPSLYMQVCFLSNAQDRQVLTSKRREFAVGIADGLATWSRAESGETSPADSFPVININVNGGIYGEQGILVNHNAYVPIDLIDRLSIDLTRQPNIGRISYRNIVYVRAADLRNLHVSVEWDNATRTVILRTSTGVCPGQLDRIMGYGRTTEVQLMMFLKSNNESSLNQFPELPKLYREEGVIEGVNYDIAFAQMCVETNFLRFGGTVRSEQNNFARLGDVGGGPSGAAFTSPRIGVRAHIQHLKAYASTEPIVQELVDPRFRFVTRGIAPLVGQLSGRWTADPRYGDRILSVLRQLYESTGIL